MSGIHRTGEVQIGRRQFVTNLGKVGDSTWKNKRARGVVHMVDNLPSKCEFKPQECQKYKQYK
jgi:hypothetical protein